MSDALKIALVAEGPTDFEVIQAALKAVLPNPFIMTLLQPEATQPQMGGGWGGVLKWCHAAQQRHNGSLDTDPTLMSFDWIKVKGLCSQAAEFEQTVLTASVKS